VLGAAQEGFAGVSDDLSDGAEDEEAQALGPGGVEFLG
jgi:hypothetical protein